MQVISYTFMCCSTWKLVWSKLAGQKTLFLKSLQLNPSLECKILLSKVFKQAKVSQNICINNRVNSSIYSKAGTFLNELIEEIYLPKLLSLSRLWRQFLALWDTYGGCYDFRHQWHSLDARPRQGLPLWQLQTHRHLCDLSNRLIPAEWERGHDE